MRRIGRLAGILTLGLFAIGVATFAQGPPPPPRPPQGTPKPPPPPPPLPPPPPANAAPGRPYPNLVQAELARWQVGKSAFLQPQTVPGGLGPVFNESSCAACHGGPQAPGGSGIETVIRFGRYVNNQYDPMTAFGGPTLQTRGIGRFNGVNFAGEVVPPQATVVAHRRTSPLYGLGLVDAIPDAAIINLAQQQHQVFPATAGLPNFVVDEATGVERVGRFGWKAQEATLFSFSGSAYLNEMGVTTPLFPVENCPQGNCSILTANPARSHPNELTNLSIQQVADFMTFNAPPPPGPTSATTQAGRALFGTIGCAQCHVPTLQAGPSPSAALNHALFAPYSDFLLHNMAALGDGIVQGEAGPTQMRTAPLWGLRFERSFLHDGRATTVDQAILAHQGQGLAAGHNYSTLTAAQKAQLLAFLNSL